MRAQGDDQKASHAVRRGRGVGRPEEARPGRGLGGDRHLHAAGRQARHRHGVGRQCLPLPVGRRVCDGGSEEGLHRLHQLHRIARRGGAVSRRVPHARHQSPLVGLSDERRGRISDRDRLGDIGDRDGPRAAAEARGQAAAPERCRGQGGQAHDRSRQGGVVDPVRRPQGLRAVAHQRDRRGLHRRLDSDDPQPGAGGWREAGLRLLLPGDPSRRDLGRRICRRPQPAVQREGRAGRCSRPRQRTVHAARPDRGPGRGPQRRGRRPALFKG